MPFFWLVVVFTITLQLDLNNKHYGKSYCS